MSSRRKYWRTRSWVDHLLCAAQDAAIAAQDHGWSPDDGELFWIETQPLMSADPSRQYEIDGFVWGEFI